MTKPCHQVDGLAREYDNCVASALNHQNMLQYSGIVIIKFYLTKIFSKHLQLLVSVYLIIQISGALSCQKGPTCHAYAWQIGPFWQDTLYIWIVFEHFSVDWVAVDACGRLVSVWVACDLCVCGCLETAGSSAWSGCMETCTEVMLLTPGSGNLNGLTDQQELI